MLNYLINVAFVSVLFLAWHLLVRPRFNLLFVVLPTKGSGQGFDCLQKPSISLILAKKALNQSCMYDSDCVAPAICGNEAKCQCPKGLVPFKERCITGTDVNP